MQIDLIKNKNLFFLIILLLAFGLRAYHLGKCELWYDEILAVRTAQSYLNLANNSYLYYTFLKSWMNLFPFSEFSIRFPSLIFSILSIILFYKLGKTLFNENIALFSISLLALNPLHIWYAQETRPYSALVFCSVLSFYFLFRGLKERKTLFWILFITFSTIGMYLHYFYIVFLATCLFIILLFSIRQRNYFYSFVISLVFVFLFFSPRLPRFSLNLREISKGFWIPEPNFKSLFITIENFNLGYNAPSWAYKYSLLLAFILFISAINLCRAKRKLRNYFWLCLISFLLPILFTFSFSKLFFSIYLDRALMLSSPYYYLILGMGLEGISRKKLRCFVKLSIFLSIFFLLVQSLIFYYRGIAHSSFAHHIGAYVKRPIKPVIDYLEKRLDRNDIIGITNTHTFIQFDFYRQYKEVLCFYIFSPEVWDTNWNRPHLEGNSWIAVSRLKEFCRRRIWMLFSDCPRSGNLDENSREIKLWMDKNYKGTFEKWIDGILIILYE